MPRSWDARRRFVTGAVCIAALPPADVLARPLDKLDRCHGSKQPSSIVAQLRTFLRRDLDEHGLLGDKSNKTFLRRDLDERGLLVEKKKQAQKAHLSAARP